MQKIERFIKKCKCIVKNMESVAERVSEEKSLFSLLSLPSFP
jgi:hypothetical protein